MDKEEEEEVEPVWSKKKDKGRKDRGNAFSFCREVSPSVVLKDDEVVHTLDSARRSVLMVDFVCAGARLRVPRWSGWFSRLCLIDARPVGL